MNEPILMLIGTSDPQERAWNNQLVGYGGQSSRSHTA